MNKTPVLIYAKSKVEGVGIGDTSTGPPQIEEVFTKLNSNHGEQVDPAEYQSAIDFLYSRINYEKGHAHYSAANYRLDRMRRLLEMLGNPQLRYKIVHVAGTKGKGTTSNATAAMLHACGYRVGVYTSPHLLRLEERIQCIGYDCTAQNLIGLVKCLRHAAEWLEKEGVGRPTFFELTTAMGFLHFAEVGCEYVVLEVGLGGRLDSTNVCQPVVTVITSISLDHQAQLGNTIAEIAGEKAGIIKPNIPVICTAQHPDARRVVTDVALSNHAPVYMLGRDFTVDWRPILFDSTNSSTAVAEVDYRTKVPNNAIGNTSWKLPLLGRHQADNLAGALTALAVLAESQGLQPCLADLQDSILNLKVPARLQIVGRSPVRIIDTAHNPSSITATLDALDVHFPDNSKTIIFASSRDKDFREMLEILLARCHRVVLTAYQNNPRAVPLAELQSAAEEIAASITRLNRGSVSIAKLLTATAPNQAWKLSEQITSSNNVICGTGSFFLAAELLSMPTESDGYMKTM